MGLRAGGGTQVKEGERWAGGVVVASREALCHLLTSIITTSVVAAAAADAGEAAPCKRCAGPQAGASGGAGRGGHWADNVLWKGHEPQVGAGSGLVMLQEVAGPQAGTFRGVGRGGWWTGDMLPEGARLQAGVGALNIVKGVCPSVAGRGCGQEMASTNGDVVQEGAELLAGALRG